MEDTTIAATLNGHTTSKKKQKKKKNTKSRLSSGLSLSPSLQKLMSLCFLECPHLKMTPANLWRHIVMEVEDYYKYTIEE